MINLKIGQIKTDSRKKKSKKTTLTRQVLGRGREAFDMLSKVLLHGVFPGFLPGHWTPALKVWNQKGLMIGLGLII